MRRVAPTVTVVPGGVCFRALASRLVTTWCSRCSSPTTSTGSSGRSSRQVVVGGEHPRVADRLEQQVGQVDRLALQRAAGVEAGEEQQVLDQRGHPAGLGLDLVQGGEQPRGSSGVRRASSAYRVMVASGVRSSWRGVRDELPHLQLAARAGRSSDVSTCSSRVFERGADLADLGASSVRSRPAPARSASISPAASGSSATRVRGRGDLAQRSQLAAYDDGADARGGRDAEQGEQDLRRSGGEDVVDLGGRAAR